MSGTALRAAWEAAQQQSAPTPPASGLRAAWEAAQGGTPAPQTTADKLHAEFKAGTLGGRMARENANDADAASADGSPSTLGAFGQSLAATGANIAQGIPGMRAAQAGIRSVVRRQPYREALSDIDNATGKIPGALSFAEKVGGAAPLAAILPGSAAVSGAIVGGADQALNADPDMSLTARGVRTAVGAGAGAFLGKTVDKATTLARSLATTSPATKLIQMQAERAASAKRLYGGAMAEGRMKEATPAIQQFLQDPDIAGIVGELQSTSHKGVAAESPEMLDAIYKTLSDRASVAKKGLDQLTPSRPNIGRFRLQDVKNKQQGLLKAMETPGDPPAAAKEPSFGSHDDTPVFSPGQPASVPRARTPAGTLKNLNQVSSEELGNEYRILVDANANESRGATVTGAQTTDYSDGLHVGMKKGAVRASGRVSAREKTIAKLEAEMQNRGLDSYDAYTQSHARLKGAAEKADDPTSFDFGANVTSPTPSTPARPLPAVMPSYRSAVEDFAKRSQEIEALQKGYGTVRAKLSGGLPSEKNLTRKTPQAFAEWAKTASPQEIQAARQGILGATKDALSLPGKTFVSGRRAAGVSANLLHGLPTTNQTMLEGLQNLGLLTAGNSTTP